MKEPKVEPIRKTWPRSNSRCVGTIIDTGKRFRDLWPETRGDYQCSRTGLILIDDKPYCSVHGGEFLIQYHLSKARD